MIGAALALFEATGQPELLERARLWQRVVDRHFWDSEAGGYFMTADDAEPTIVRPRSGYDTATPSGNALMLGTLGRLFHITGEVEYRERAVAVIRGFSGELAVSPLGLCALLNAAEVLERAVVVTVVGFGLDARTQELRRTVTALCLPDRILLAQDQEKERSPYAFICSGQSCSAPFSDSAELRAALLDARGARENVSRETVGSTITAPARAAP